MNWSMGVHDLTSFLQVVSRTLQLSEILLIPMATFDESTSPFETFGDFSNPEHRTVGDTMRVTCEDPGQQEERKRWEHSAKFENCRVLDGQFVLFP